MVERQFDTKVKTIRLDNIFKLESRIAAISYLAFKGIVHQNSCDGTPWQNEVVEKIIQASFGEL